VLLQPGVSSKGYRACSFLSEGAESRSKPESRRRGGAGVGSRSRWPRSAQPCGSRSASGEALGHQHYRQSALPAAGTAPAHGRPVLLDPAWGERLRHDHFIPCEVKRAESQAPPDPRLAGERAVGSTGESSFRLRGYGVRAAQVPPRSPCNPGCGPASNVGVPTISPLSSRFQTRRPRSIRTTPTPGDEYRKTRPTSARV
jgi:hypothetical protein